MGVSRLGAVAYLNARPLVHGLERRPDLFALRFDAPSRCAVLLHEGAIDVGMIPSVEFERGVDPYRIVEGMGIVSDGPVASVALFSARPLSEIRTIAVDTSSRTSTGLLRVLCRERFAIEPELVPMARHSRRCSSAATRRSSSAIRPCISTTRPPVSARLIWENSGRE